ncbi:hypothetical protein SAMN06295974_3384 [Plantibacter flavus]|uniref:Uncharacterized protein n=1 Tax=Plantibacter flavus TaxID=150123 RepID=A0A3N2C6S8_9MICO|nr:sce7725 family protein [Plantibacter flavus]ROR83208.1 hypothetical protein EDD42_3314 [Plantibacter flavus]SMG45544.1 hypothetical protein SAMN06295974_3384 [Plantibacter flavus]
MYYPFFRGKQFELLAIRESAGVIADAGFHPIIEPVRETLSGLERTLQELEAHGGAAAVIINPRHGDHRHDGEGLEEYLQEHYGDNDAIIPGILLSNAMSTRDALQSISRHDGAPLMLIHAGFTDGKGLAASLTTEPITHAFLDARNTLYRRHFRSGKRILIEDGFERMKNSAYGPIDRFSDLHITYAELGGDGYGDFLTVGDYYSEGGGPAYAVAIHLTFIDPDQDGAMFVYHFVSDSNDTPVDPAGKFAQALDKLIAQVDDPGSNILETSAVSEFRELHARSHFPGLGYIKKLSIRHHLETLADFHA